MRLVDFNLHLTPQPDLANELDFRRFDAPERVGIVESELQATGIEAGNLMLLDSDFLLEPGHPLAARLQRSDLKATVMIDPRRPDAYDRVDAAAALGMAGIKFHPYELNLADHDFPAAIGVAQYAGARGLWCAICCSYGTLRVFDVSGVRLVSALARAVKTPLIALHGGGRMVLEVMSMAFDAPNLLIDTSFSVSFWRGSSVETDFAFAIRKLGAHRWLYGSDHPYVTMQHSRDETLAFLEAHHFSAADIEQLMAQTALELFNASPAPLARR